MKRWQIGVSLVLLTAVGALVVVFPPTRVHVSRPRSATLVFVGDIMLSRSVGELMAARQDWLWPFRRIASVTAGADLAFANLESVISDQGTQLGCGYCFRADPRAIAGLASAGFDVLSVANNHAWDYGRAAFDDTVRRLRAADIDPVGAGREPVIAWAGDTRVAFLAYTDLLPASACSSGVNCYDPARMVEDIAHVRTLADVVVVSFHTGEEYMSANDHQRTIYRAAVDAGADLVVGHHPHVVQEFEQYGRGWIAYSLGNFVFDQNFSEATMIGMMLVATIRDGKLMSVAPRTVAISREHQPALVE
jgi:poly-gamma-glutamate capsule biosynthesis protein CapA/YwtB (metallophosphatase superfamily)